FPLIRHCAAERRPALALPGAVTDRRPKSPRSLSQVTCSSPRTPWINCRMLLALVSTIDSITSLPLPLARRSQSLPCALQADILDLATHSVASLGEDDSRQRSLSLKGKVPFFSPFLLSVPSVLCCRMAHTGRFLIMH